MPSSRYSVTRYMGVLIFFFSSLALFGQTTGAVTGAIVDPSSAPVVGAEVKLTSAATGLNLTATSDGQGNFQFLLVPPGNYALTAGAQGFKSFRREGIVVEADRSQAVPIALTIGQVTETVEVQSGAVLLEANTSEVGTVMDRAKIDNLPLSGRNPMGLANLIPTVRGLSAFGGPVLETFRSGAVNIGGGTPISQGWLIDGLPDDKIGDAAGGITFLTVDATQEFKVITNTPSAEYGRTGGGIISIISKGGTNEYHGLLFEYLRNTEMKANDFFSNRSGFPRTQLNVNQYGGTFGGPLKKDKIFFFYNYEGYKERRGFGRVNTAPTDLQRSGDFSQTFAANGGLILIYDPSTTRPNPAVPGGYVRTPFPGNKIPLNRQGALAQKIFSIYPRPNTQGAPVTGINNLFQRGSQPSNRYDTGLKVDYNISDRQRIAVRYTRDVVSWNYANFWYNPNVPMSGLLESEGRYTHIPRNSFSMVYTNTLSPTLLLDAKLGYNRDWETGVGVLSQKYGDGYKLTDLGYPANYAAELPTGRFTPKGNIPNLNISDLVTANGFVNVLMGSSENYRVGYDPAASISITKVKGSHNVKVGYLYVLYGFNTGNGPSRGLFAFDRGFTQGPDPNRASATAGFGMASFLLGTPSGTQQSNSPLQHYNTNASRFHALFVQDDWKVARKLTLNLGMRWESEQPITDRSGVVTNIDLNIPSPLQVPGMSLKGGATFPNTQGGWNASYRHFQPRGGFAYQVTDKLVARGGYGITFIPTKGYALPSFSGFRTNNPMVTSLDNGLTPFNTMANPFPSGLEKPANEGLGAMTAVGSDLQGWNRGISPGFSQQWNLTVQYQPWRNWLIEVAYLGNRGEHLLTSQPINFNQIDPQYLALGNQLNQSVSNPFYGIIKTGPLSNPTVARQQLLRPYPHFNSINGTFAYLGDSIYHAGTLKVEKRFDHGFSLLLAYTKSKLIDGAVGAAGSTRGAAGAISATDPNTPILNWYNLRAERSRSIEDVPQRIVLTGMWEVPFGKNLKGVQRLIAYGWHLNAISTLQGGLPIAIQSGNTNRPNVVSGQNPASGEQTLTRWFNTAAYSVVAPFTYGNASRTIPNVSGPGIQNIDCSIFKDFSIRERFKLQFRGEAFNLFNTPLFDVPGRDVNTASFGVVSSQLTGPGPRELQFSLRLSF